MPVCLLFRRYVSGRFLCGPGPDWPRCPAENGQHVQFSWAVFPEIGQGLASMCSGHLGQTSMRRWQCLLLALDPAPPLWWFHRNLVSHSSQGCLNPSDRLQLL